MQLITLSGVDGSGKSTQVERLRSWFELQGKSVVYFHAVRFSLPHAARQFFQRTQDTPGSTKAKVTSSALGVFVRKFILRMDLFRFRLYLERLRKEKVDILLSDRYFYDTLVNIAYLDGTVLNTTFSRRILRHIPKPDRAFYLEVIPEKVMERGRPPEQGLKYLKDKSALFKEAASLWSYQVIDANQDEETVFETICQGL